MSPTQEVRACILGRQYSPARKNRTRKKKSTVEDAWKIPEKNKINEPSESWNQHNHERDKGIRATLPKEFMNTALQIVKNGDTEDRKAKEQKS